MIQKYKKDICIILGLIFLSVLILSIFELTKKEGNHVIVIVNGEIMETYDLNIDKEVILSYQDETYNILEIKNHQATIIKASCPDKLCCKQHSISKSNETITCLPNKVVIKVISEIENIDIESGK